MHQFVPSRVEESTVRPGPADSEAVLFSLSLVPRIDERRLRQILAVHLDFVWRCLQRMGVPSCDCDDAAQQVFLVAADKLSDIRPASERAFLFGTATRIAANARRARYRRDEAQSLLAHGKVHQDDSPEELTDQRKARAILNGILDAMPDGLREVFVLFELEELNVFEVADVLQIPMGTVGSRLRRAREVFQQRVRRFQSNELRIATLPRPANESRTSGVR
jgi:RNA polymerase sigma-70 factor (ECF subfamily)